MRKIKSVIAILGLIILALSPLASKSVSALDIPPAPSSAYILDNAEILSPEEEAQLTQQIQTLKNESTNELAILTVKDGEGVDPAQFATQVGREWGVGTKENKNGAVIFVSLENPKRIQIAVSTGLEGVLTDGMSGSISRNEIAPKFKESKYYEGLSAGVEAISKATKGEYVATESSSRSTQDHIAGGIWAIVLAMGLLQLIFSLVTATKSWWFGGVLGGAGAGFIGLVAGSLVFGMIFAIVLVPLGLLFDYLLSKNYKKHADLRKSDKTHHFPWYFGGGGGFGSGSSSGGFSGGGFSGGGSFGGGGGGSSW